MVNAPREVFSASVSCVQNYSIYLGKEGGRVNWYWYQRQNFQPNLIFVFALWL